MPADGGPVGTFNGRQVRQGGPRRLRDAVEWAVSTWKEHGSPSTAAFRATQGNTPDAPHHATGG
ncbi:hypothetical protein CP975_20150 [Streptomyces alboniger]|uniref:Uncharacterized protein n=1 Tax=Streptomyces alboniger TaxID=132473 RepID=A0A5J6HM16_STRAD|nr:hypothetical protein CP975_20150 [Streptomyces alboniger]